MLRMTVTSRLRMVASPVRLVFAPARMVVSPVRTWLAQRRRPVVTVLELHGVLANREGALNLRAVGPAIDRACRSAGKTGLGLILDIDSPGGSPVQSELIASRIRRRAAEHNIGVHAVIEEVGASGGYWLACAADDIRAGRMSIVGSIGVVSGGFGAPVLLARAGIERRLYTAGTNKARLDPFSPEKPEDVAFVASLMGDIHAAFKAWVRDRRGARLGADPEALFDGSIFLGEQAVASGLIDGIADVEETAERLAGGPARLRVVRPRRRRGLLARLPRIWLDSLAEAVAEVLVRRALPELRL
jgi:signal peptide peptidase SppA